ncbi:MAG TPA: CDP-alcohol phosphatidyltransferase family protein [Lapillicoccus sp.]|uniref:CDP-alcohol phosphatidyltransferase family protein n=1 Tax=Lapillicoccus sp. TaxID=1909287 RepID=UPI002F942C3D
MSEAERTPETVSDRVLTLPNVLSALRLVGVPVFLWLLFTHQDIWAFVVLTLSGITDYLDGKIARRFNLVSRVGQLLDPLADRLYVLTTLVALTIRDIIPLWLLIVLVGRDLFMGVVILLLKRVGQTGLPVHFVGKAATFNLLYAFPILLLSSVDGIVGDVAQPLGWAFAWWGVGLYLLAAVLYAVQAAAVIRAARSAAGRATPGAA